MGGDKEKEKTLLETQTLLDDQTEKKHRLTDFQRRVPWVPKEEKAQPRKEKEIRGQGSGRK